ncbi:unnamed protein product [Prunus armeniaca]
MVYAPHWCSHELLWLLHDWLAVTGKIAKPQIWQINRLYSLGQLKPPQLRWSASLFCFLSGLLSRFFFFSTRTTRTRVSRGVEGATCVFRLKRVQQATRGDDYTISQALFSIDMLIIFIATLFGLGSSFTATDNLGQIREALGYRPQAINTFVSLHSIWNFFGRIFSRFPSEILLMKYKIPRPLMLTLALILASFGYLFIVFPFPGSLYFASVIIGFTLGLQLPLCVTIISKLFGLKHYVLLLNFSQLMSPLASYILNVKITGALYDKEAMKELARLGLQRIKGQPLTCIGTLL